MLALETCRGLTRQLQSASEYFRTRIQQHHMCHYRGARFSGYRAGVAEIAVAPRERPRIEPPLSVLRQQHARRPDELLRARERNQLCGQLADSG